MAALGGAPDVSIVAVKVLHGSQQAFCCMSDIIAALDWVAANHPEVDVVNLSLERSPTRCTRATATG